MPFARHKQVKSSEAVWSPNALIKEIYVLFALPTAVYEFCPAASRQPRQFRFLRREKDSVVNHNNGTCLFINIQKICHDLAATVRRINL